MALLNLVEQENATGKVAEIYQNMMDTMGFIPNAFKIYSPSEHILGQQVNNLNYYFRHSKLSGQLLAFVRLLVSEKEKCEYCVTTNTRILFQYGILPEMVNEIIADPTKVPLDEKEKALLFFVLKVVRNSTSTTQEDIDSLRNLGWTDNEIMEATYHGTSQVSADMIFNAFKVTVD